MTRRRSLLALFPAAAMLAAGCGGSSGGGGSGSGTSGTAGIAVPREISALPASSTSTGSSALHLRQALSSRQALSADSDYSTARTYKFVDEQALSQFNILNTIFKAIGQTHYDDAANVGAGPYGAMVSWEEDKGDSNSKSIVNWVVQSDMVGGENVLHVWMMMPMGEDGSLHLIRVKMTISEPPTQNADGSYADYGIWRIDAAMEGGGSFAAEASRDADGLSVIAIRDSADRPDKATLGVLHKSATTGYGKVSFPDWNDPQCMDGGCDGANPPPSLVVAYRYDADAVALKKGNADPIYKDRTHYVDFVQRYGLYDADGNDVTKSHSFGFPVQYADSTGNHFAYYGAWQGRHQLWANGQAVPAGTTVVRQTWGSGAGTETYTVSPVFTGILVKRTLVPADIADLQGIILRTGQNESFQLMYQGNAWTACYDPQWDGGPQPTCAGGSEDFTSHLADLQSRPDMDENVWINACEPMSGCFPLVYQDGTFYKASQSDMGPPTATTEVWSPVDGANCWVNINRPAFIFWNGSRWMEKVPTALDQYHNPIFDGSAPVPFDFPQNQEQYLNDQGTNYVIKTTDGVNYAVQVEQQEVANPGNAATFATGLVFRQQYGMDTESTFSFDPATLALVYETPGSGSGHAKGDVFQSGAWDLQATKDGTPVAERYNWEYPDQNSSQCDTCGKQQFLEDSSGEYTFLDDPIRLVPVALASEVDATVKKYPLAFDGNWVQGLPSIFEDLQAVNGDMNASIAAKVVNVPDGKEVRDADGNAYRFRQLQVTEYLLPLATPRTDLDLAQASGLDLAALAPTPVDPGLGAMPQVQVKYSEGNLVQ
jgi:hypothetical protein